jgi:peptide deformylase
MTKHVTWQLWRDEKMTKEEATLLRKRAADLPIPFNAAAKKDIQTLVEAFLKRNDALGLAAPQIGISKRIIAFKVRDFDKKGVSGKDDYEVLINARITQLRGETEVMNEGCLSCPDISVEVTRATEIKVKAVDINGNKVNKRYTGFLARIVQHEIDHLDGRLVIDHEGTISYPKEKQEFFDKIFK